MKRNPYLHSKIILERARSQTFVTFNLIYFYIMEFLEEEKVYHPNTHKGCLVCAFHCSESMQFSCWLKYCLHFHLISFFFSLGDTGLLLNQLQLVKGEVVMLLMLPFMKNVGHNPFSTRSERTSVRWLYIVILWSGLLRFPVLGGSSNGESTAISAALLLEWDNIIQENWNVLLNMRRNWHFSCNWAWYQC